MISLTSETDRTHRKKRISKSKNHNASSFNLLFVFFVLLFLDFERRD